MRRLQELQAFVSEKDITFNLADVKRMVKMIQAALAACKDHRDVYWWRKELRKRWRGKPCQE